MAINCTACDIVIDVCKTGEPYLPFKNIYLCSVCYVDILEPIYKQSGYGDGGVIHYTFQSCLASSFNRRKRQAIPKYKKTFEKLKFKYKSMVEFANG